MIRVFVRFVAVLSVLSLVSCATQRQLGEIPSFQAERKLGEDQLPQFLIDRGGIYSNGELTRYLNQITDRLAATIVVPDEYRPLRVRLLDTSDPSAFALPGGKIFISRGIVAFANSEAQLAGVIAHEITHVVQRHSAKRIAANERQILDIVREKDKTLRRASRSRRIAIVEREFEARLDVISAFSKEQELEADRLGLQMVTAAGYDPSGFGELLKRLEAFSQSQSARIGADDEDRAEVKENSGYPKLAERVAALGTFPKAKIDKAGRDRLMGIIDGIDFDDRYQGGIVRDGVYWNPIRRIAFDLPREVLPNHGESFQMVSQHGLIDLRIESSKGETLDSILENLQASDDGSFILKRATFNGYPAITGRTKFDHMGEEFVFEVTVINLDGRFAIFGLVTKPKDEEDIRPLYSQILNSARTIEFGETLKRRRYRTRRIRADDTVASLLEEATFDADGETEFRLLNGLETGSIPPVGEWIKFVE